MNVQEIYSNNQPSNSGGLFLKLNDGDTIRMRILDLPAVFDSEYEGKTSTKYAWPVYNHDAEEQQIFQGGATIYNALNGLIQDADWGDPKDYDIKVSRTGKGTDTKYTVAPSPKSLDIPKDLNPIDLVDIIGKSQYASNVHILGSTFIPLEKEKDIVLDDIDEGPVDLSEIPF